MKNLLFLMLLFASGIDCFANEYKDPATNVIYTYDPATGRAEVKQGGWDMTDDGVYNPPFPGSPDAKDEIVILDTFSVDGKEYVVDKIGDYALCCLNMKSIVIPSSVKSIGNYAFAICRELSNLVLPGSIKSIGSDAFSHCFSITTLSLPEGLEEIKFEAFGYCYALESVTIPSTVTSLKPLIFFECNALKTITSFIEEPTAVELFYTTTQYEQVSLRVPCGTKSKYESTSGWSNFKNIIEMLAPVTFTEGQMATIILPTMPDAGKGKYYRLDKCEEGQIIFEQELQPQARTPYIIVPREDFSIDPSTLDLEGLTQDAVSIEGISFIGTYTGEVLPSLGGEGSYYDIIDTTPDCTPLPGEGQGVRLVVGALRAYLFVNWDDPINHPGSKDPKEKLEIVLKDNGTSISSLTPTLSKGEGVIYDLSGRRLYGKPTQRIYIEDRKKKMNPSLYIK